MCFTIHIFLFMSVYSIGGINIHTYYKPINPLYCTELYWPILLNVLAIQCHFDCLSITVWAFVIFATFFVFIFNQHIFRSNVYSVLLRIGSFDSKTLLKAHLLRVTQGHIKWLRDPTWPEAAQHTAHSSLFASLLWCRVL